MKVLCNCHKVNRLFQLLHYLSLLHDLQCLLVTGAGTVLQQLQQLLHDDSIRHIFHKYDDNLTRDENGIWEKEDSHRTIVELKTSNNQQPYFDWIQINLPATL